MTCSVVLAKAHIVWPPLNQTGIAHLSQVNFIGQFIHFETWAHMSSYSPFPKSSYKPCSLPTFWRYTQLHGILRLPICCIFSQERCLCFLVQRHVHQNSDFDPTWLSLPIISRPFSYCHHLWGSTQSLRWAHAFRPYIAPRSFEEAPEHVVRRSFSSGHWPGPQVPIYLPHNAWPSWLY